MDVGNTVRRGLRRFISDGTLCGEPAESDGGNGAAMRNLPVILSTLWNEDLFYEQSLAQAHITHNHRLSDAGTIGLGALTRVMLLGGDMARVSRRVEAFVAEYPEFRYRPWPGRATGYIVDTVQTVLEAFFSTDNFEDCVVKAVNRGGDADTTGALAGQLAGAMYGIRSIPARWLRRIDPVVLDAIRKQTPALLEVARRTESVRNFTSPLILSEKGSWKS